MDAASSSRPFRALAGLAVAAMLAAPAAGGVYLGSLNCMRLGHAYPSSSASQPNKRTQIKNWSATNSINCLQEVMVTSEVANVRPSGYSSSVSGLKGTSSYSEAYGFTYNVTASGGIVNYSSSTFSRPPSGMRLWTGSNYTWIVNYHAAFDSAPNIAEIEALNGVYNYYKNYASGINDVVIAGDYNRSATSTSFNNLKNAGCSSIQPNVATSINTSGAYASAYDHFAWNPSLTSVTGATRSSVGTVLTWRNNVSDHAPIRCFVN